MQQRDVDKDVPVANADGREELRVSAPALEASQQPGFKVVDEGPKARPSKIVWTAVILVIGIAAAYALGYFR